MARGVLPQVQRKVRRVSGEKQKNLLLSHTRHLSGMASVEAAWDVEAAEVDVGVVSAVSEAGG